MKKKAYLCLLIFLLLSGCSQRKNPVVEGNVPWQMSNEMDFYLGHSVWTYNNGEEILFMQFGANVRIAKTIGKNGNTDLGDCSKLKRYYVSYHEIKKKNKYEYSRNYPYLQIGDQSYDFLEIKEDSFTLADFNNGEPCTFTRKEKGREKIKGKYIYNGKTYFINFFGNEGSLLNKETNRRFEFIEIDEKRIQIQESILSDIPIYRWREDEEGNLILLSEGYDFGGMSNEEIFQTFPVIVLEKID